VVLGFLCLAAILSAITGGCLGQTQDSLNGTRWTLISYSKGGSLESVVNGTEVTLNFGPDRVSGSGGCNQYGASYTLQGSSRIAFSDITSTLIYCPGPAGPQEEKYFSNLRAVSRYTIGTGRLTFFSADGEVVLVFEERIQPAPLPLRGTLWELVAFHDEGTAFSVIAGTTITARFGDDGYLSGSAGCNEYFGTYSADGSVLSIGTIGTTKKFCTAPVGIMVQESAFTEALKNVRGFSVEGTGLSLKNGQGDVILSFRGSPAPGS
jgi:heat shock protein HslJ